MKTSSFSGNVQSSSSGNEQMSLVSSRPKLMNTYIASFSALLHIVVLGMAASYSAPATVDMKKFGSRFRDITQDQITWIASLPGITSCIGNCVSGYVSQKLGRRAVLLLISAPYVLSWLMITYAPTISWIYCGRLLTGFCYGICSVAVPAYVIEIAPLRIRGLLVSGFQVAFTVGVFLIMTLGYALRWSWLSVTCAMLATLGACLMYLMPESPAWLLRESRRTEAIKGIKFLRGKNVDIEKEFENMMDNLTTQPPIAWRDFLDPVLYKPILISVLLMFFQQTSGINTMTSYTVEIFQSTGSSIDPSTSSVIFAGVQVITTVLSSILMDKVGRRLLYITSGILVAISLVVLGIYCFLPRYGYDLSALGWIPLICLMGYITFFSMGFGPVPIVIIPELVPIHSRSLVLAMAIVSSSFFSFVVTKTYGFLVLHVGYYGLFWIYGIFTSLATLFGWLCLPETKGRTIADINRSFSIDKSP